MPNWACGNVSVTGTKQAIMNFTGRFIYSINGGVAMYTNGGFFSRSFVNEPRQLIITEIEDIFSKKQPDSTGEYIFPADFAWSAYGCLFRDSPEEDFECINLSDACVIDKVSVEIHAEEPGMGFEESISCDETGEVYSDSKELVTYQCPKCGGTQGVSSFAEPDDIFCYECGDAGLVPATDEEQTNE